MQKSKKQKHQKQLRANLKTWLDLTPNYLTSSPTESLVDNCFPRISDLNTLRMLTLIQIHYSKYCLLKTNTKFSSLKLGIIGGGFMGRMILNCVLPYTNCGLLNHNIVVSTRQVQNLWMYSDHFGIKVIFDNEAVCAQSDILFVCTPATLDNWILIDVKKCLSKQAKAQSMEAKDKPQQIRKVQPSHKPLVYILTSDISAEKAARLFPFPVLTPSIRAKDLAAVKNIIEQLKQQEMDFGGVYTRVWAKWIQLIHPLSQTPVSPYYRMEMLFFSLLRNSQEKQYEKDTIRDQEKQSSVIRICEEWRNMVNQYKQ